MERSRAQQETVKRLNKAWGNFLQGTLNSQDGSQLGTLPCLPGARLLVHRNLLGPRIQGAASDTTWGLWGWIWLNDSPVQGPRLGRRKITGVYDRPNP